MKEVIKVLWGLLKGQDSLWAVKQLASWHNSKAEPDSRIIIKSPVIHTMTSRSNIAVKLMQEEPKFFNNIKAEKTYDLRHQLIDELWNAGDIRHSEEINGDELTIKIELYVYEKED